MNLQKWFGLVLGLGLILALTPITASAWPNQSSHPQFNQGFTRHQPGGQAYGRYGQRPPMFRHNRTFARGQNPFQRQRFGQFQGNQNSGQPWMGQPQNYGQNYGTPYASPGYQGYPYPQQPYSYGQPQGNQNLGGLIAWLLGQRQNYGQNYGAPYTQGYPYQQPYPQPYHYGQSQGSQNFGPPSTGPGQTYGQNHGTPHGTMGSQGNSRPGLHVNNL
jgi:hypothetical protein